MAGVNNGNRDLFLDILTKEEREALLTKKMDEIRKKNEAIRKRHEEIEADKRSAQTHGNQARQPKPGPKSPPVNPGSRLLTDRRREGPAPEHRDPELARRHYKNFGGTQFQNVKVQMRQVQDKQRHVAPQSPMDITMTMTGRERREYTDWKKERERVDQDRIQRQRMSSGEWKRAWDSDKKEDLFRHVESVARPAGRIGSGRFNRGDRDDLHRSDVPVRNVVVPTDHQSPKSQDGANRGRGRGRGRGRLYKVLSEPGGDESASRTVQRKQDHLIVKIDNSPGKCSSSSVEVEVEYSSNTDDIDTAPSRNQQVYTSSKSAPLVKSPIKRSTNNRNSYHFPTNQLAYAADSNVNNRHSVIGLHSQKPETDHPEKAASSDKAIGREAVLKTDVKEETSRLDKGKDDAIKIKYRESVSDKIVKDAIEKPKNVQQSVSCDELDGSAHKHYKPATGVHSVKEKKEKLGQVPSINKHRPDQYNRTLSKTCKVENDDVSEILNASFQTQSQGDTDEWEDVDEVDFYGTLGESSTNEETPVLQTKQKPPVMPVTAKPSPVSHTGDAPLVSRTETEPSSVHTEEKPLVSHTEEQPLVSHAEEEPLVSYTEEEPLVSHTEKQPLVSHTGDAPSVFHTEKEPSVSHTEEETLVSHTGDAPSVSHTEEESSVSHTEEETLVSHTGDAPSVSHTEEETLVSHTGDAPSVSHTEAETLVSHTEEEPLVSHTGEAPLVSHTKEELSVSHTEGDSSVSHTEDDSSVAHPEEEPLGSHAGEEPAVSHTEGETLVSHTREEQLVSHAGEESSVSHTEEDPLLSHTEEEPSVSHAEESLVSHTQDDPSVSHTEEESSVSHTGEALLVSHAEEKRLVSNTEEEPLVSHSEGETVSHTMEKLLVSHTEEDTLVSHTEEATLVSDTLEDPLVFHAGEEPSVSHTEEEPFVSYTEGETLVAHTEGEIVSHAVEELSVSHTEEEPIVSHNEGEPLVSHAQEEPLVAHTEEEPSVSHVEQSLLSRTEEEASVSHIADSLVSHTEEEPSVSHPEEEPLVSHTEEESSVSHSKEEPSVSHSKEEPLVSHTEEEPSVSHPKEELLVSHTEEEPSVSHPEEEPSVSHTEEESLVSNTEESVILQDENKQIFDKHKNTGGSNNYELYDNDSIINDFTETTRTVDSISLMDELNEAVQLEQYVGLAENQKHDQAQVIETDVQTLLDENMINSGNEGTKITPDIPDVTKSNDLSLTTMVPDACNIETTEPNPNTELVIAPLPVTNASCLDPDTSDSVNPGPEQSDISASGENKEEQGLLGRSLEC